MDEFEDFVSQQQQSVDQQFAVMTALEHVNTDELYLLLAARAVMDPTGALPVAREDILDIAKRIRRKA